MITLVKTLDAPTFNAMFDWARNLGWFNGAAHGATAFAAGAEEAPTLDLSGEFADEPTPASIVALLLRQCSDWHRPPTELHPDDAQEMVWAYEASWNGAASDHFC